MPLLKPLHEVSFTAIDKTPRITHVGHDIAAEFGIPESETVFPYEGTHESLTLEVVVRGFPTKEAASIRGRTPRTGGGSGTWLVSERYRQAQESTPLQMLIEADSADMKSWDQSQPDGQLWVFQRWAYVTMDEQGLEAEDVRALINVKANKRRLLLEKAHALQAMSSGSDKPRRRETIPQPVRLEVWQRDGGHCVECGGQEKLEFDHIIPVAMGGGNTSRNLQLLCETCNRRKGASLG